MSPRQTLLSSSVVEKVLIGATGLALALYLVVHLAGNLLLFLGPTTFNGYAHALISNPIVVPVELGLLAIFLLHVWKTAVMWWHNRKARPDAYVRRRRAGPPSRKSLASSTMIYTGVAVGVFVVLHVARFKYGAAAERGGQRDLYGLVVGFFQHPLNVVFYEACLGLVGLHLWHGLSSAFESLGVDGPRFTPRVLLVGRGVALLLACGFALIPIWAFLIGGRS